MLHNLTSKGKHSVVSPQTTWLLGTVVERLIPAPPFDFRALGSDVGGLFSAGLPRRFYHGNGFTYLLTEDMLQFFSSQKLPDSAGY